MTRLRGASLYGLRGTIPETEARPTAENRHGRAPRGAASLSQGTRAPREECPACRSRARHGCLASTRAPSRRSLPVIRGKRKEIRGARARASAGSVSVGCPPPPRLGGRLIRRTPDLIRGKTDGCLTSVEMVARHKRAYARQVTPSGLRNTPSADLTLPWAHFLMDAEVLMPGRPAARRRGGHCARGAWGTYPRERWRYSPRQSSQFAAPSPRPISSASLLPFAGRPLSSIRKCAHGKVKSALGVFRSPDGVTCRA